MKKGCVYLLEDIEDFSFKIGFTTVAVEKRVKQLQCGNSADIEIVHVFHTKNYAKVEKMLHLHFYKYKKRGEWFDYDDTIYTTFLSMCELFDQNVEALKGNPFF